MSASDEDLERIVAVDHADPHSVLGLHEVAGVLVARAFRPDDPRV
jgi:hypothetical protein